jgi:tRNA(Ile2) C34 agmatinyltransferase TiaS
LTGRAEVRRSNLFNIIVRQAAGRVQVERLMPEAIPPSHLALTAVERPTCPKCRGTMTLVRIAQGRSGFDIRTFDCGNCDHAHIMTVATDRVQSDKVVWLARGRS